MPADPRVALEELRDGVSRLANDLYRIETDPGLKPLLEQGTLAGESAEVARAAAPDLHALWSRYSTLTDTVGALSRAVDADDEAAAATLLGPSAIEFSDGSRCDPHHLLASLRGEVDAVLAAGERLGAAWRRAIPRLDTLTARLADTTRSAGVIGVGRQPALLAATDHVDRVRAAVAADPLAADAELDRAEAAVERARRRIDELATAHGGLARRLAAARSVLDELERLIPEGRTALEATRAKIAEPRGLLEPLDRAAVDAGPHGLGPWLARLEGTAGEGSWLPASEGLDAWEELARTWLDNARAVLAANRGPLDRRAELRGLLDAYAAKAAAHGEVEDPALSPLHAAARDALYTQPCDLDGAADLVARYGDAVREAVQ
ncbi:MAG TPA: hypothetical protein VI854_05045 [Acidimicrobiia bacterium]|nr:hypothetical protein [Acidimicrobiia bacterium]